MHIDRGDWNGNSIAIVLAVDGTIAIAVVVTMADTIGVIVVHIRVGVGVGVGAETSIASIAVGFHNVSHVLTLLKLGRRMKIVDIYFLCMLHRAPKLLRLRKTLFLSCYCLFVFFFEVTMVETLFLWYSQNGRIDLNGLLENTLVNIQDGIRA